MSQTYFLELIKEHSEQMAERCETFLHMEMHPPWSMLLDNTRSFFTDLGITALLGNSDEGGFSCISFQET